MKYFTINELTYSATAKARGIRNDPHDGIKKNLIILIEKVLDPVRVLWGKPIKVNSGYRSPELNIYLKGAKYSQHMRGEAVDITAGGRVENKKLFELIKNSDLQYDQLINESDYSWIHLSYAEGKNRKQILHL